MRVNGLECEDVSLWMIPSFGCFKGTLAGWKKSLDLVIVPSVQDGNAKSTNSHFRRHILIDNPLRPSRSAP